MDINNFGENSVINLSWDLIISRNLSICIFLEYLSARIACVFSSFKKNNYYIKKEHCISKLLVILY
ncbi:MAG: hypothetical protein EOL97_07045 [Spirochaetia bacterium]|nr:hypothetical protein [Spirochaetia bacterium]